MVYPHKWSSISYRSSAGQRKHAGQRPMFYRDALRGPGSTIKLGTHWCGIWCLTREGRRETTKLYTDK